MLVSPEKRFLLIDASIKKPLILFGNKKCGRRMPKIGMKPLRRDALVKAAVEEIGAAGNLDVTVGQIARRAGMSPALAHHYFGKKDQILLAAMRYTLSQYGEDVRGLLAKADGHYARLAAIIHAGFTPKNFRREVVAAWLNFYVLAQTSEEARRLLAVYHARLHSNLVYDLRPLVGDRAGAVAQRLASLIDGVYLRGVLRNRTATGDDCTRLVLQALDSELKVTS